MTVMRVLNSLQTYTLVYLRFLSRVESNYLSQMLLGRRESTLKRRCFRACTENMLLEVSFSDDRWVEHAHQS